MCMHNAQGGVGGNEMAVKTREKCDRGFQNGYLDITWTMGQRH